MTKPMTTQYLIRAQLHGFSLVQQLIPVSPNGLLDELADDAEVEQLRDNLREIGSIS